MSNWAELKRLAEEATGGDWEFRLGLIRTDADSDGYVPIAVAPNSPKFWRNQRDLNMKFIAVANPKTILALIAENERLKISYQSALDDCKARWTERDQARAEVEALRKDALRWKCVRNAIPMQSPYAVWREGSHLVLGKDADELVDNFLKAKDGSA